MNRSIRFHVAFSSMWVLSKRDDDILPVEWLLNEIKNKFDVTDIDSRVSECSGMINLPDLTDSGEVLKEIKDLITNKYPNPDDADFFRIEAEEVSGEKTAETGKPAEHTEDVPGSAPQNPASEKESAIKRIENFVGADKFKELARECVKIVPHLISNNIADAFTCRSYLISINDGCGLTTYLNAFAELVGELKLFNTHMSPRAAEFAPDPPGGDDNAFKTITDQLRSRSSGNIICIDISEWMSKLSDKDLRKFLRFVDENVAGQNIVFFKVPFVEQNVIKGIEENLRDIFTVTTIVIPPFTGDELIKCASSFLSDCGYSVNDDVWEIFNSRIISEKSDGRFYGINTVKKIAREMLYEKQLSNIKNGSENKIICKADIVSIAYNDMGYDISGNEQLDELVGIESIRSKVEEIIAQIEASLSNKSLDSPCIHMRFIGNPGTGKTTVARIIGKILKEKGILRNGNFFEHSGRDLCGRYIGETAPKTAAICRDAYGSVLFIDEAYSLYRGEETSPRDYGREAIDTLIAEMENHRSDMVVIMAGYPDDMEKLMEGNAGLKSRMPYLIEFPNYTKEHLAEIFLRSAKKSFSYDSGFEDAVKLYFSSLSDEVVNSKEFSNARFVRNLFERTWGKAALRCQLNGEECTLLTVEDFALATSDKEFHNIMEQKKRTIGFAN